MALVSLAVEGVEPAVASVALVRLAVDGVARVSLAVARVALEQVVRSVAWSGMWQPPSL